MIALITGASSGIGRAMSLNFASRGFNLVLVARRKEKMLELKKEIRKFSDVKVKIICKDLSDEKQCRELYEEVKAVNIDILINNAGFGLYGKFTETDLDRELEMINTNIRAVHILTKLFLKDFEKRNYGFILNVASAAGFMAGPMLATYYATKNYVLQLTKAIYEELRQCGTNVYIGALCPGPVNTDFNKIAGAEFSVSGSTDEEIAEYAISNMFEGELIIIPKNEIKLAVVASRLLPSKLMLWGTYHLQHIRRGDSESPSAELLQETDKKDKDKQ